MPPARPRWGAEDPGQPTLVCAETQMPRAWLPCEQPVLSPGQGGRAGPACLQGVGVDPRTPR